MTVQPQPLAYAPRSASSRALRAMIMAYQAATVQRGPACRFVPSCSQYALDALGAYGVRRALPMVLRRLVRCRPRGPFGYDPVPGVAGSSAAGEATESR